MRNEKSKKEQRMRKWMDLGDNGEKEVPRPHAGLQIYDSGLQLSNRLTLTHFTTEVSPLAVSCDMSKPLEKFGFRVLPVLSVPSWSKTFFRYFSNIPDCCMWICSHFWQYKSASNPRVQGKKILNCVFKMSQLQLVPRLKHVQENIYINKAFSSNSWIKTRQTSNKHHHILLTFNNN